MKLAEHQVFQILNTKEQNTAPPERQLIGRLSSGRKQAAQWILSLQKSSKRAGAHNVHLVLLWVTGEAPELTAYRVLLHVSKWLALCNRAQQEIITEMSWIQSLCQKLGGEQTSMWTLKQKRLLQRGKPWASCYLSFPVWGLLSSHHSSQEGKI